MKREKNKEVPGQSVKDKLRILYLAEESWRPEVGPLLVVPDEGVRIWVCVCSYFANARGPPAEPRNPETPKVHFKVRKMPF